MPVSPFYKHNSSKVNARHVKRLIRIIDCWIKSDLNANRDSGQIRNNFIFFGKVNYATLQFVVEEYKATGWVDVSLRSDFMWYLPTIYITLTYPEKGV